MVTLSLLCASIFAPRNVNFDHLPWNLSAHLREHSWDDDDATLTPENNQPFMSSGIESAPATVTAGSIFETKVFATDKDTWLETTPTSSKLVVIPSNAHSIETPSINSGTKSPGSPSYLSNVDGKKLWRTLITAHPSEVPIFRTDHYWFSDHTNPIVIHRDTTDRTFHHHWVEIAIIPAP